MNSLKETAVVLDFLNELFRVDTIKAKQFLPDSAFYKLYIDKYFAVVASKTAAKVNGNLKRYRTTLSFTIILKRLLFYSYSYL